MEYDPQYILQVNHLKKYFPIKGGMVSKTVGYVKAVDGVTFNLKRGTTMGLVGESADFCLFSANDVCKGSYIKGLQASSRFVNAQKVAHISLIAACAAARRAMGTRNGLQET